MSEQTNAPRIVTLSQMEDAAWVRAHADIFDDGNYEIQNEAGDSLIETFHAHTGECRLFTKEQQKHLKKVDRQWDHLFYGFRGLIPAVLHFKFPTNGNEIRNVLINTQNAIADWYRTETVSYVVDKEIAEKDATVGQEIEDLLPLLIEKLTAIRNTLPNHNLKSTLHDLVNDVNLSDDKKIEKISTIINPDLVKLEV
jgi:hypothetical protein